MKYALYVSTDVGTDAGRCSGAAADLARGWALYLRGPGRAPVHHFPLSVVRGSAPQDELEKSGVRRSGKFTGAAAILAGVVLLVACGTNQSSSSAAGGSSCDSSKGSLVIGLIAPLSGGLSAIGLGMKNSADLAIRQANEKCAVPGYRLVFQPEDDQGTPQVAAQAA